MTILFIVFSLLGIGQITTTKIASDNEQAKRTSYDSLNNFLDNDVARYIGQEFYLKGKSKGLEKFGYENLLIDYKKSSGSQVNIYKCCDSYNSKYNELVGKYYKVLDVIRDPQYYGRKFYIKLQEKTSGDTLYYVYNTEYKSLFPFVVVGFFEKIKKLIIGQEFVFDADLLEGSKDINTGKVVTTYIGQKWKCIDFTVEETYFNLSLIMENSDGDKASIDYEYVLGDRSSSRAYFADEADKYRKKFGKEDFETILKRKVRIGMTKEMCKLSWGEPKSINQTITSGRKSEQWVYSDNYLYFKNGLLTTIQKQ